MNEINKTEDKEEIINNKFGDVFADDVIKYAESVIKLKEAFSQPRSSFMQDLLDFANTKFGYGLGEAIGNHIPEIIKILGQENTEQIIDDINKKGSEEKNKEIKE